MDGVEEPILEPVVEEPIVDCWGCSKLILVPCVDGKPAEVFKCGWCGAVNNLKQQPLIHWSYQPQHISALTQSQQPQQQQQAQHRHSNGHWQQHQQEQQTLDYYSQQQHQWQHQQQWQPAIWQPLTSPPQHVTAAAATLVTRSNVTRRRQCCAVLLKFWRCVVVALVLVLVGSIAGCGIITLLPLVCTTWATYIPNVLTAFLLLFQIVWNYAAAVLRPAGRVSDFVSPPFRTPEGYVPQGGLQHWSWCQHCQAAKPPQAHHCKTCGTCVYAMDHHCPFIANCVGQGNLRSFLLVLLWALVAAAYILCMCSLLVWQHWDEVKASVGAGRSVRATHPATHSTMHHQQVWVVNGAGPAADAGTSAAAIGAGSANSSGIGGGIGSRGAVSAHAAGAEVWLFATTGILMLVLQESPWWLLAAYYLVAVSLGILLAVGMLLGSQLQYLGMGVSYVDHLKAVHGTEGATAQHHDGSQQQQQVFAQEQSAGRCKRWLSRMRLIWARWWDVIGPVGTVHTVPSMLWAVSRPRWDTPSSADSKKWS